MQLFSAARQGLSVTAQSLFTLAMAARTPQDLRKNPHALQLCVVHLVGHTMQHDRYIAGIVVIHDQNSGHCVVYWPAAPHALVLSEYASLQLAHAELNRIGALAANVKRLARQVAPDWAFEAITHHPDAARKATAVDQLLQTPLGFYICGAWVVAEFIRSFKVKHLAPTALADEIEQVVQEQIASDPLNWLAIVATSQSDASALLYRAPVQDLPAVESAPGGFLVQVEPVVPLSSAPFAATSALSGAGGLPLERNYYVLKQQGKYYRLLETGTDAPLNRTVFVMKDQRLISAAAPAPPNNPALTRLNQLCPLPLRKYRAAPWAPRP